MESVGTGMNQVAKAVVEAGIGWGIINREVDYIPELRKERQCANLRSDC